MPVSVPFRFCRLCTNRPAPKSSRKLSATCAATSPLRRKSEPPEPATAPTVSLSVLQVSGRLARSAGSRPNTMPVRSVRPNVKARMRASGDGLTSSGAPSTGMKAMQALRHHRRQPETDEAAGAGEQQALDEELAHELAARGAERQPHGDLALAHEAARDEQVGDVGAGDEQHQADHAHQHDERRREVVAQARVADVGRRHVERARS